MIIAQYSFTLGGLSSPSKIVGGAGALPLPPPMVYVFEYLSWLLVIHGSTHTACWNHCIVKVKILDMMTISLSFNSMLWGIP